MDKETYYLVRGDALPEAMQKTVQAKLMIERGDAESVAEAVAAVGLSRSAFYRYRDAVLPFERVSTERIVTLFFYLEDKQGVLSRLLQSVASFQCNVLTIHQTIPVSGRANVTMSIATADMSASMADVLAALRQLPGVARVDVVASGI
ncbi:MAG: ACT domain-containing protein [Bacilli bacterium]